MTDAVLADVCRVEGVTDLNLAGSKRLTDEGVRHLARLPGLKHLDFERYGRHRPRPRGASRAADARERVAGDDACHRSRRRAPRTVPGAAAREPGVDAYG